MPLSWSEGVWRRIYFHCYPSDPVPVGFVLFMEKMLKIEEIVTSSWPVFFTFLVGDFSRLVGSIVLLYLFQMQDQPCEISKSMTDIFLSPKGFCLTRLIKFSCPWPKGWALSSSFQFLWISSCQDPGFFVLLGDFFVDGWKASGFCANFQWMSRHEDQQERTSVLRFV